MLTYLFKKYGSDKFKYSKWYEKHLETIINKKFTLIEFGVASGASLKAWKSFLPKANIIGVDINPSCKNFEEERIEVVIGDQTDVGTLETLPEAEVIIDDGGHRMNQQIQTFQYMFPKLHKDGGIYVIEDLQTSFNPDYGGNEKNKGGTALNYFKELVDDCMVHGKARDANRARFKEGELEYYEHHINAIHFYNCICFIEKI